MKNNKSTLLMICLSLFVLTQESSAFVTLGAAYGDKNPYDRKAYQELACAPEVEQGNLAAAMRVLKEEVNTASFQKDLIAKAVVKEIDSIKDTKDQIVALFKVAGVESNEQVIKFTGGIVEKANISSVAGVLSISEEKALHLANKLSTALRGSRE